MAKIERKFLAHYIDASFSSDSSTASYVRLGSDLEEYNEELNPDIEVKKNILGAQRVNHNGYEVQSEVEPYYADYDDPLFEQLSKIANERLTGDDCATTKVDVLLDASGGVLWAYREKVHVVPNSIGGDTSGVQIPFSVYNAGERVKGTWDVATKTFVANESVEN